MVKCYHPHSVPISTIEFLGRGSRKASSGLPRKVRSAMARDGAVAFANLFPRSLLERMRREVLRRHESGELRARGLVRDIGGRYAALLPFEGPFLDPRFYASPALREALAAILGPSYCIGSLEAVVSLPGSGRQHQHVDGPIRFEQGKRKTGFKGDLSGLPPYAVTLCVPLCDVDEENGPTELWRGSHRAALRARFPSEREIARRFPAERMTGRFGRSFMFDFRTFHRGLPNYSREPRPLLMFVFTRPWFRDPNLADVFPRVVITERNLKKVPARHRGLFMLAPAARRPLWSTRGSAAR